MNKIRNRSTDRICTICGNQLKQRYRIGGIFQDFHANCKKPKTKRSPFKFKNFNLSKPKFPEAIPFYKMNSMDRC